MWSIMKTWQDNDVIDSQGVISEEYNTELSRPIGQCAVYDNDELGQGCDWSYKSTLRQKWN